MNKLENIKNKLALLSSEQLDIVERLINSWKPINNKVQTDDNIVKEIYEATIAPIENPVENYSKEELLEEYGVLFYNQNSFDKNELTGVDISYNFEKNEQINDNPSLATTKYDNLDISALISNKPISNNEKYSDIDDYDPLFPDTDFDSLTDLNKSKYDNLDFSSLISKKIK